MSFWKDIEKGFNSKIPEPSQQKNNSVNMFEKTDLNDSKTETVKSDNGGFLSYFIGVMFIAVVVNIVYGVKDIYSVFLMTNLSSNYKLFLLILDSIFELIVVWFSIFTIYSLIALKPNAISLTKMYLILAFISNSILLFISVKSISSDNLGFNLALARVLFDIIALLYFINSDRVEKRYPEHKRKTYTVDVILFVIALILDCILLGIIILN